MAVSSLSITQITLQPKLRTNHGLGFVFPRNSVNSHSRKNLKGVSLRRNTVVVSAITGASGTGIEKESVDLLETVKILDLKGNEIPISDLWKDRKAVVAFARHFGCVLCRKRAAYLAAKKDVMDASGVALVLIGPGSIEQANTFVEQTKFEGEVYADPDHASYEALKFASGVSVTFTPKAALKIIESYMEGYRQDWKLSFMKDTVERGGWQQGGVLVAGPGKDNISYIRKDKEAGDDPPIEEILKACCA
ncbi:hypothetical protein AALP_AA4G146300 [Arabis alpina]|uniref:Thioredoxin domain-containing protein n=1 Tax=Arabis alpina TaxID=50452 RepID=A0A087H3B0_ARAAL|nr:hypothetical protein AALP_AA4G146300 [Arabis alpina]